MSDDSQSYVYCCTFIHSNLYLFQELKEDIASFQTTFKGAISLSQKLLNDNLVDEERAESYRQDIQSLNERMDVVNLKMMDNGTKYVVHVCLSVCLCGYLFVCVFFLFVSWLFLCLFVCLCLCVCLCGWLFNCLHDVFVCLFLFLFVLLFVR